MAEPAQAAPARASYPGATPAASDLLNAPSTMTVEQATIKKAELVGKAGFADAVLAGDSDAVKQWREVTRALRPAVDQSTAEGQQYSQNMDRLAVFRAKADLPEAMFDHVAAGGPVSAAEKEAATYAKQRLMKDKAWVQRYLDGDRAANSEMTRINFVLASRIGTFDEIEAFKAAAAKRLSGK